MGKKLGPLLTFGAHVEGDAVVMMELGRLTLGGQELLVGQKKRKMGAAPAFKSQ